jgi:hypothetical protein
MENFEKATKMKLRFASPKGTLSIEDLWDLSLNDLDTIAIRLNKEIKEKATESFVHKENTGVSPKLQLSFDVVKRVIEIKMKEAEAKKKATELRAQKARIMELIEQKRNAAFSEKSVDELMAELSKIDTAEGGLSEE